MPELTTCSDEELFTEVQRRTGRPLVHTMQTNIGSFTMTHPLSCPVHGCKVHAKVEELFQKNFGVSPLSDGLYQVELFGEENLKIDRIDNVK